MTTPSVGKDVELEHLVCLWWECKLNLCFGKQQNITTFPELRALARTLSPGHRQPFSGGSLEQAESCQAFSLCSGHVAMLAWLAISLWDRGGCAGLPWGHTHWVILPSLGILKSPVQDLTLSCSENKEELGHKFVWISWVQMGILKL